jgi:hypothetical protein
MPRRQKSRYLNGARFNAVAGGAIKPHAVATGEADPSPLTDNRPISPA